MQLPRNGHIRGFTLALQTKKTKDPNVKFYDMMKNGIMHLYGENPDWIIFYGVGHGTAAIRCIHAFGSHRKTTARKNRLCVAGAITTLLQLFILQHLDIINRIVLVWLAGRLDR